jgi:phospholipid transport system substrate-binding protein
MISTIRRTPMLNRSLDRRQVLGLQLALVALLAGGGAGSARAAVSADAARALIVGVGVEVLAVLRNPDLAPPQKFDLLVELLDGPIDLDLIARLILGRHWRTASEAQQAEYLELFRAFALDNLASKLQVYDGQDFEVVGSQSVNERDALVQSLVSGAGQQPLKVDWRVRERGDGNLVAIDVIIEGISLIVTQRSEFSAVIERSGMDGLLAELRQRVLDAARGVPRYAIRKACRLRARPLIRASIGLCRTCRRRTVHVGGAAARWRARRPHAPRPGW